MIVAFYSADAVYYGYGAYDSGQDYTLVHNDIDSVVKEIVSFWHEFKSRNKAIAIATDYESVCNYLTHSFGNLESPNNLNQALYCSDEKLKSEIIEKFNQKYPNFEFEKYKEEESKKALIQKQAELERFKEYEKLKREFENETPS